MFLRGQDSVKEGESLLLMFLGIHSFCHNTTPFSKKNKEPFRSRRLLDCKQYVWECFTVEDEKRGCKNVLPGSRSRCVDG